AASVSRTGIPLARVSTVAQSSRLSALTCARRRSALLLSIGVVLLQEGKALWAASNASSTSSLVAVAALLNTCPSMGEMLSKYSPLTGGTNLPPIKLSTGSTPPEGDAGFKYFFLRIETDEPFEFFCSFSKEGSFIISIVIYLLVNKL